MQSGAALDPAGGLTVTKEQLMEALEKTYDKKVADANADPMLRFADPQVPIPSGVSKLQ
jgi:hypothetical protein